MKTYTPDRSPTRRLNLPPVQDKNDASASESGVSIREFIVMLIAAMLLTIALFGIAVLRKQCGILIERTQGFEIRIADLLADLDAKNAQLQTLEVGLNSAIADRDHLKESLSTTKRQLDRVQTQLERALTQLEKLQENLQELINVQSVRSQHSRQAQEALEQLRREHFEQLLATGEILSGDPAIALKTLSAAGEFATANGLQAELASSAAAMLPHATTIPEGSVVSVMDVYTEGEQIVADVLVKDASGRFLSSLSRVDFEILSGNKRLHLVGVASVQRNNREHRCVLLLDNSGSTTGAPHRAMQQGGIEFVNRIANPSRVCIYSFDNDVNLISPWSIDAVLHQAAIQKLSPDGGTSLFKAVRLAKDDLLPQSGPRSIVLFADGDNSVQFEDIEKTLTVCRDHSIAIHVVALKTAESDETMLRRIASETNGLFLSVSDPARLAEQFRRVAAAFLQPAYRIRIYEPVDDQQLTLRVGSLAAVPLKVTKVNPSVTAGT